LFLICNLRNVQCSKAASKPINEEQVSAYAMRTTEYASSPFLHKDEHEASLRNFILLENGCANPEHLVTGWIISYSGTQCFLYNLCNIFPYVRRYVPVYNHRAESARRQLDSHLLLVTLRTPRIWMWFRDQFNGFHPVVFKYQFRQICRLSPQHNYSLLLQHSYIFRSTTRT